MIAGRGSPGTSPDLDYSKDLMTRAADMNDTEAVLNLVAITSDPAIMKNYTTLCYKVAKEKELGMCYLAQSKYESDVTGNMTKTMEALTKAHEHGES